MQVNSIISANKQISIYQSGFPNASLDKKHSASSVPLILYNSFSNEGSDIINSCQNLSCPPFSLAIISIPKWNQDMSPWPAPSLTPKDAPFEGSADKYISSLLTKILPDILREFSAKPSKIFLTGYSMAGLFALYTAYQTNIFDGIASVSGSLWYPGFIEYVKSHEPSDSVQKIYFSLGDKESRTRNQLLSSVMNNTLEIEETISEQGIETIFESNEGNHFKDNSGRMAKGIKWLLS